MTSNLFFKTDGAEKYPRPIYIRDFAAMSFGKLMVLLITSIWNACLFHFLAWLHPSFKKYFAGHD